MDALSSNPIALAIPNWNGARYIGDTLDSLRKNRPFVKWYLQDSCSTDRSVEIAKSLQGPDDRIVVEKDACQSQGLNRAMAKMGGEIIGFLNSDDLMADGAAEAVLLEFAADPELDLVYGEVEWIDESGASLGYHSGNISSLADVLSVYQVWWNGRHWVQPEVFWRRRITDRVGPFNEKLDLAFDFEYWVRCFEGPLKVKRIPRVLARFRRHALQKSSRSHEAADEIRKVVTDALARNPKIGGVRKRLLAAQLAYDRYQIGQMSPGTSLSRMLLRYPSWAALPEVRSRALRSAMGKFRH
jgi:glycosyltransferase involved in cell wall biosynthesis